MFVSSPEVAIPTLSIEQRIKHVVNKARTSARRVGRDPAQIKILAVSKQKTVADIRAMVTQGFLDFGESYVAEALPKLDSLASAGCTWHYVGVVQSNKTKRLAQHFDWVQSIDRIHVGRRLADARAELSTTALNVCVQVNIDDEPTKAGVSVDQVPDLVEQLQQFPQLQVRGLMAIPNPKAHRDATRHSFRRMRELFEKLQVQTSAHWDTLSMGMTGDYEIAIEEGATMIRIGTALFGPRI
ncbi:MAG: YggS family pyridoxal phosphate-dependent enzyme [Gammaproteobacteria bacterium]|nr:YggS family pyridoxal phosphate-dependent enzyme [Gammaproteobacteria bacterium]